MNLSNNFNKDSFSSIQRTMKIEGKMIPAFICNGGSYFYVNLEVYSDGVIDTWGAVDLDFFKQKLKSNWVATTVPDGKEISIHHLANMKIKNAQWYFNNQLFYDYVFGLVKEMNPELQNLYNFHGTDIEIIGKARVAKLGILGGKPIKPEDEKYPSWRKVKGDNFLAFYKESESVYYLCNISVFPDESIKLDRIPQIVNTNLKGFEEMITKKEIVTEIKAESKVKIYGLGEFEIVDIYYQNEIASLLGEIKDTIAELNSKPTSSEICKNIYDQYMETPSTKLKEELKEAYEKIPEHLRIYVLRDMDAKDIPVRMIIYGDDEIESWSHYAVAKSENLPLPKIDVPKPEDE